MQGPCVTFCNSHSPLGSLLRRRCSLGIFKSLRMSASSFPPSHGRTRPRVLSGVQPSGALHLGNYLGAVRQWASMQDVRENFFAVVDLHAVTVSSNKQLAEQTMQAAAMYIACGIDPSRSSIFVQSHVTAHAELCWLLNCVTPHGWLDRMIQFKEKSAVAGESASVGLFVYPVLQAADVLLYNADIVPAGEDQRQHIELARDIARRYNDRYCKKRKEKTFIEPKVELPVGVARVMSLDNGLKKMSKSAVNDGSRINMTDAPDVIAKKIKRCKTDSATGLEFDNPERQECHNLLTMYQAVSGKTREQVESECGEMRWGTFKPLLADALIETVDPIRREYHRICEDRAYIADVLAAGHQKASAEAQQTIDRVKSDMGFLNLEQLRMSVKVPAATALGSSST